MKKRGLFAILFGMAVLSFGLFNSCDIDIGLGSAVDVEPPTLFIENPPASKIIRDAFPISGTYKDDGTISAITVELTNTETQVKYPKIDGTWGKENTWSATVDPIKLKIPDGKYEATITISDNGGHHSSSTRSFIIDNTAPVVVLSRPASDAAETDLNKIESYGQYLTLEGQAADDNDIEKIVIKFYSKDDPDKDPIVKEITSIPPTISLDVAKFLDENDPTYTKLYGTDKNAGEKYYYCTISAFDGAKRYPAKGDEKADDDYGNEESSYILWTDWEKFQSEYSKTTGSSSKIKLPELYSIKAGKSETTQERSVSEKTLISAFFNKAISRGSFKLNPLNNPSYSISGLDIGLANDVENERPLTVQLSKGLDGLSLDTDNMKVYLIPLTIEDDGTETRGKKIYPQQSTYEKKGDGQFITVIQKDNVKDSDGNDTSLVYGTTYVIGVDGEDIEGNKIVPSFDGKEFFIRFKAKNVAPGLTIDEPVASTSYLKKGDKLLIKGTTSVPDGYPTVSITCKKGAETTATTIYTHKVKESDKVKIEGGLIYYNWQFEVPTSGSANEFFFDQGDGNSDEDASDQYVFDITSDLDNMPTSRTKTVLYDLYGPTISIDSMLPTAEKYTGEEDGSKVDGDFLNGDVEMKIAILDDYDSVNTTDNPPYFYITDESNNKIKFRVKKYNSATKAYDIEEDSDVHYINTPTKQTFIIKTKDIADEATSKNIKVKIVAQDRAGNLGVDIDDNTKTYYERSYTVDQKTDIPVILPYNHESLTLKYETKDQINDALAEKKFKSILTTGTDLLLSLKDDDGIKKTSFFLSSKDNPIAENATPTDEKTLQDKPSDYNFRYTLPTVSGRYECRIIVEDKEGNTNEKKFWIIVTGLAPQVSISSTTPDNKIITLSNGEKETGAKVKFENDIAIESGYTEFTVTRIEKVAGEEKETVLYGENGIKGEVLTAHSFTDEFIPAENHSENKIKYVVTDEMGHSGEREFTYYIDSSAPVVDPDTIGVPSNTQSESVSFRFTATSSDPANGLVNNGIKASGVSKLEYTFDSEKGHIKTVNGVSSLNETVLFADEEFEYVFGTEGTKTLFVRAIDDVGNIGAWVSKSFMFDKASPTVTIDSYQREGETRKEFSANSNQKSFETGKKFTLSGTVSDSNGLKIFEIWQKKEGESHDYEDADGIKLLSVTDKPNGSWTIENLPRDENDITQNALDSGTYTYTIRATDKSAYGTANAKTTYETLKVYIDKTNPEVSIDLAVNGTSDSTAYGENSLKGNAYTFRGTVSDDPENEGEFSSGFSTLYYEFTTSAATVPTLNASSPLFVKPTTNNWSIPMNLVTATKTDSGSDSSDTLTEGKKYLWVRGVDNAGNWSEVKHVAFMVDQNAPEVTFNVYKDDDESTPLTATNGTIKLKASDFVPGSTPKYTLRGTVWDANGINKLFIDNEEVTVAANGTWSKEITRQGTNVHTIVVEDKSGRNETGLSVIANKQGTPDKSYTIIFDTVEPNNVSITGYDEEPAITETETMKRKWLAGTGENYINGTANDSESGLAEIKIIVDKKDDDTDVWTPLTLASEWTYKYQIPSNLEENDDSATSFHTVSVKAIDKAGNETVKTRYFRYDKTLPYAELTLNKNDQYVKASDFADISFSGYAHDGQGTSGNENSGRAVGSAKIKVVKDNDDDNATYLDVTTSDFGYVNTPGSTFGNFSKTGFNADDFADGKYKFTLEVKDKAGNSPSATSTLSQTMIVDKTPPQNIVSKLVVAGTNGSVEKTSISTNNPKATIQVTFTEPNIDSVYYYVDDSSVAGRTQTNAPEDEWIGMNRDNSYTGEGYKYTKAHQFGDGKGKVYIKIVDKAGNVAYATPLEYEVDTKKPDVCTLGKVWVKNDDNSLTELSGTKLINGTKPIVFSVTATDYDDNYNTSTPREKIGNSASKIKSVVIKSIGNDTTIENVTVEGPTAAGVWTLTIPAAQLPASDGSVTVTVKDKFDNEKDYPALFSLDIDTLPPRLESYSLATSYDAGVVGAAGSEIQTFYMNNEENDFKLEGIAKDDRVNPNDGNGEIEKVVLTLTESGTNGKIKKLEKSDSAWTFKIENNEWKTWTGDVTGTLSVTDKAKNVVATTKTFKIIFDNDAPKAMHFADKANKDIYFRIGNAANDKDKSDATKWETGDDVGDAAADKANTDVGKKYSYDSWGNDSTIEIRGNFYEAASGSGLKTIYYAIFDSDPTTTNVTISGEELTLKDAFESGKLKSKSQSTHINAIGSFAPLETAETRKVPYTAADGSRLSQEVVTNFRTSLPGFNGVENYLLLVAEDYVGNRAVDDMKNSNTAGNSTWNSSKAYYHINKDATAPSISGSVTEGSYTNGSTGNIVVSGTARDNDGGSTLSSVSIRITDSKDEPVLIETKNEKTANTSGNTWDASIPASTFSSGVYTVYAKATDKAGNFKEVNSGTITFDNTKPTIDEANIKFTETKGSSTTNVYKSDSTYYLNNTTAGKTFKLSGLAQDNLAVDSVNITVKNNAGTVVESLSQEKPTNGTWDFTIGNWSSLTTGATIVIDAKDKAGNTLEAPVQFAVKFDINAPEVVSANLKVPEPSDTEKNLFKFEGKNGSVTDSGTAGTLSGFNKVEFAFTKTNEAPTASTYIETATVDANGAWSSNVEFKKQALQSVFGTSTASDEGTKYLWLRAYDNAGNVSSWVSKEFVYDTETPKINFTATVDNETTHITTNPTADSWRKYGFDLKVNASDSYRVKKVEVEYGTTKVDITDSASNEIYSKSFKVGTEESTATKLDDGSYIFKVIVTDESGKTNYVTRSFNIDTTAPAVSTKTLDKTPDYSKGENTVGWYMTNQIPVIVTVSDGSGSGVTSVQVSTETEVTDGVTVLKNPTSLILSGSSWTGSIVCKEQGLNTIYIKATDATGNSNVISTNDSIPVNIDTTAPLAPVFLGAGTTPASEITSLLVNKESNVTVYAALKDDGESDKQTGIASSAAFIQKDKTGTSSSVTPATILAFTPEWTSNHDYSEGNVVKYGEGGNPKLYSCTSEHKSGTTFDTSKWTDLSGYAFWSYEIKKEDMTNGGINFTVKDNAGNTADYTLFQMVVDTENPTVTFNDISNLNIERASTDTTVYVNGTITLSGSANDNQKLATLKVEYQKAGTSTWTEIPATTNTSLASWSRTWNTKATGISDEAIYTIRVSATDAAGWPTQTPATKTVKVSQKTDRPVVSFSNVTLGETMNASTPVWLKNTTKIIGTVSDDDGIAANGMKISLDGTNWSQVTLNGSSFSYDLQNFYTAGTLTTEAQANGPKTIYFQVKDTANNTAFESSSTNIPTAVYLSDGIDKYGDSDDGDKAGSILHVKVDTIYPEVVLQGAKLADADEYTTAYNTITLGGAKKSFTVKFTAADTNGIGSITGTAEFPYGTGTDKITVSGTGLTEPSDNVSYYTLTFTLSDDQVNQLKASSGYDGAINVRITATDKAGMQSSQTATLAYDYKPSVVGNEIKPVSTTPQSGEVGAYGSVSEAATIRYIVSPSSTVGANGSVSTWVDGNGASHDLASAKTVEAWKEITDATLAWTINFDNSTDTNGTHEKSLNKYLIDYGIAGHENNSTSVDSIVSSFTDYVTLYLWINTIDAAGNEATKVHPIIVDPQGDRPNLQFSYPTTSGGTLGGQVSIYGTATDTKGTNNDKIGVDSVWVQIKSTTHGTDTTTNYGTVPSYDVTTDTVSMNLGVADLNYMKDKGYHVYNMKTYNAAPNATNTEWNGDLGTYTASDYAALATLSGAAWNIDINGSQEFDPPTGTSTNPVAIRVYARDKDKKFSLKAERYVSFDADTPIISDLKVVKSTSANLNAAASTNSIVKTYSSGMYIKGTSGWYLTGTVTDKDKIKSLIVNGVNLITFTETDGSDPVISIPDTYKDIVAINTTTGDNPITTVTFKYPLTTSADVGTVDFNIVATDGIKGSNAHTTPAERVLIKYDNKSPVLATTTAEGLDINTSIYQSNKRYKFGSKVNEDPVTIGTVTTKQSGFAYTAFYFTRNNTVTEKDTLFDVLNPRASAAIDITDLTIADLGSEAKNAADNTIVSDSNLYWYRKTITEDSLSGSTFTLNNVTGIRPSSLMKIDGAFYLVTEVNGNSVTVDSPVPSTATVVYAAIAGVVNNTVPEGEGGTMQADGYYSAPSRDDGDRMIESVDEITTGTTWKWSASICSSNMTDGAVTLHYVVFDQAGNYTSKTIDCNVANNAPRLASLKVWSDFNEDGNEQEGEYDTFYYNGKPRFINGTSQTKATELTSELVVSNNKKDYNNDGTAFMTVKAKTRFIPEIVGGNNALYYSYRYKKNKTSNWTTVAYGDNSIGNGFVHGIQEEPVLDATDDDYYLQSEDGGGYIKGRTNLYAANYNGTKYYMEIPGEGAANSYSLNGIGNSNSANDPTWFEYTIYDSTDGSETNWKKVENGEVTYNTANRLSAKFRVALNLQYVDTERPQTVISPLYWNSVSDNSVYKDVNGTLFGHVELKGDLVDENGDANCELGSTYGTDDDKVSGKVVFRGFAYDNKKLSALNWAIVEHNNAGYDSPSYKFDTAMKTGATFADGTWTNSNDMTNNHYTFVVSNNAADGAYHNQNGHKVAWTLTVDTSHITGIVGKDLRLIVQAVDTQAETATTRLSTISNTENISTADAESYRSTYKFDVLPYITSITTRLAKKDATNPEVYSRTAKGHYPIASDETATGSVVLHGYNLAAGSADVDISSGMGSRSSGAYAYPVTETITTINNMNNNDAHGAYNLNVTGLAEKTKVANMYNRQPNTSTNLKLTDDVYFDMWEFNSDSATSGSALRYPVMHINPSNNQIGFGFVRGSDSVSFPANGNSYLWYQKNRKDYIGTNFVYDSNGVAHNVSIGLDAQFDTGIAGRMLYNNSNWWIDGEDLPDSNQWGQAIENQRNEQKNNGKNFIRQWDKRYSIALETIGIPNGVYVKGVETNVSGGEGIIDIDRFSTPAIAASAHSTGTAVYIMYYDSDHDQIRFRYGEVPNTGTGRFTGQGSNNNPYVYTNYGLLNDSKSERQRHNNPIDNTEIASDTSDQNSTWSSHGMFEASKSYYALVTGKYYNQSNDGLGGTAGTLRTDTGNNGSAYYALGVVPGTTMNDDKVVMIWFDQVANKLMYMYRMNLGTNKNASNRDASSNGVTNVWSKPEAIYSGALQDCVMTVDVNGGIHIAAYDQNNANLLYMYKQTYNTTGVISCVVDAYSQVGNKLTIDTALNSANKVVPYISYFAEGLSSLPKLAYLPDGITTTSADTIAASIKNGADASTNLFTGDWEVSMIPTSSKLQSGTGYNVSIGVFKDKTTGKVGQAFKPAKTTDVVTDQDTRKRYANGTTELVLGYSIKDNGVGYIETAMRK